MSTKGASATVKASICDSCNKPVGKRDTGIACEVCSNWFHTNCIGIDDKTYDCLKTVGNIHWYCDGCNSKVVKFLNDITYLQKKQEELEDEMRKMKSECMDCIKKSETTMKEDMSVLSRKVQSEFDKLSRQVDNLQQDWTQQKQSIASSVDQDIDKQIEELTAAFINDEGKWADIVKKQVDNRLTDVTDEITYINRMVSDTKSQAEEEKDKELRKKNVIIYNIAESSAATYDVRINEDKEAVMKILKYLIDDDFQDKEIAKMFRLGRRNEETNKPRAILIQFENGMTKNYMMNNLHKLRKAEGSMKNIVISYDMTLSEREQRRALVKEAKDKEAADILGEWIYRVRGLPGQMKVVRWRKQN